MVEYLVRNCIPCQSTVTEPKHREPLKMTQLPDYPWQRVSVDFCEIEGREVLVVIDDYSRYPVIEMVTTTSAKAVIPKLDKIFSAYGVPEEVKSDNGPPFNSNEFRQFAKYLGFKHRKITPLWPEANGEVERFMRTLKKAVRTSGNWTQELHKFLRSYRATPHCTTGVAPAASLFNRPFRTRLPEIPNVSKQSVSDKEIRHNDQAGKQKMKEYADNRRHTKLSSIQVGDTVLMRNDYATGKCTKPYYEKPFKVTQKKGSMVTAKNDDRIITRNSSKCKQIPETASKRVLSDSDMWDQIQEVPIATPNQAPEPVHDQPQTVERRSGRDRQPPAWMQDFVVS